MHQGIVGIYIPRKDSPGTVKAIDIHTKRSVIGKTVDIEGRPTSIYRALMNIKTAIRANLLPHYIKVDNLDVFLYFSRPLLGFWGEIDLEKIIEDIKRNHKIYYIGHETPKMALEEFAKSLLEYIAEDLEKTLQEYYENKYKELFKKI